MAEILILAYYFEPYPGVGAKRASYWAKHLREYRSDHRITVVTATAPGSVPSDDSYEVVYVPDSRDGLLSRFFKSDRGASWSADLRRYFHRHRKKYDFAIFTGGPFMHFGVASLVKRRTSARIIFDYRDPMSLNPRTIRIGLTAILKMHVLRLVEILFNARADAFISVNPWCLDLVVGRSKKPSICIDNGYDETELQSLGSSPLIPNFDGITLAYAGKFSPDRDPRPLMEVLAGDVHLKNRYRFIHLGEPYAPLSKYHEYPWFLSLGPQDYRTALAILNNCDFLCIFTAGHPFESTTKIFDYIGLGKPIIVFSAIAGGSMGAIPSIIEKYGRGCFVPNDTDSIKTTLRESLTPLQSGETLDKEQFSRKHGLELLTNFLDSF